MRCDTCGQEYSSKYYFHSAKLCLECHKKQHPEDVAAELPEEPERPNAASRIISALIRGVAVSMNGLWLLLWLSMISPVTVGLLAEEASYVKYLALITWCISGVAPFTTVVVLVWALSTTPPSALRYTALGFNGVTAVALFAYGGMLSSATHFVAMAMAEAGFALMLGILAGFNVLFLALLPARRSGRLEEGADSRN